MPSSFIWYPRKYRDAVDPKLVLLLEVNVDFNTDFRVGERRKSSGKPSDLKWGRNEQHVEKVLRPAAIGLFEVVHLGGNINNESALGVFLFKVTEQITRKSHYINGASLPLLRRNDRLVRSGLSWRTSVPTSRGSPAFLWPLSLSLPHLLFRGLIFILSCPPLKLEGSPMPLAGLFCFLPGRERGSGSKVKVKIEEALGNT